jgi:hypothetical protein
MQSWGLAIMHWSADGGSVEQLKEAELSLHVEEGKSHVILDGPFGSRNNIGGVRHAGHYLSDSSSPPMFLIRGKKSPVQARRELVAVSG